MNGVIEKDNKKKGVVRRGRGKRPGIDMTPVVDLAFLLLTFFMLTTTFSKPQIMEMKLPEKSSEESGQPRVHEKSVLTIVPGENDRIFWYVGLTDASVNETDYSDKGIRGVLLEQKGLINKMVVLLKPGDRSTYENLVTILDELEITGIQRYALADLNDEDYMILDKYINRSEF